MSADTSFTQLCSQQLDDILGPDLTQFEILIYQLISKDEDQVSRSKALFHLALRSRPDSLLLTLSELLSPGRPLVRAEAAKQIGEIFTTFSSNFRKTTLDTLKLDLLSACRNEVLDSDVRNHLLLTISNFHATGCWPELLPYLLECVDSQSHYLQEYALLVFKSLAENSNGNAALIPYLETFQKNFSECLGNCSSWDVKIAALEASISFVQFIPNREDPNRFDYLLKLMMLALTEALNSASESKTEDSLHFLIKLAETNPSFFERQLVKVLQLMLKITVDDSLEVNIKHLAIEFLIALVEKAPRMIKKEPQFIKRLFDELMYMLFDIEGLDAADAAAVAAAGAATAADAVAATAADADAAAAAADAAAAAADDDAIVTAAIRTSLAHNLAAAFAANAADAATTAAATAAAAAANNNAAVADAAAGVAAANASTVAVIATAMSAKDENGDGYGDGDEVDNFWESSNYILGKECLSKLSILLGERIIFQWILRLFSHLLGTSIRQQRHAVLIAIPKIAKGCCKVMLENLDEIVPEVLKSLNDLHPYVRLAAVNAIRQLSVDLGPEFQTQYHEIVLVELFKVMKDSRRPKLQAPAASAIISFFRNGSKNIINIYDRRMRVEFSKFFVSHFPCLMPLLCSKFYGTLFARMDEFLWHPVKSTVAYSTLIQWVDSEDCQLSKSAITELKSFINVIK